VTLNHCVTHIDLLALSQSKETGLAAMASLGNTDR